MVQNTGTSVPVTGKAGRDEYTYAISRALRSEVGQSARATKTLMKWTGASERAAKYWLAGSRAPSGAQLILLARNSDAVLDEVLRLCGRDHCRVAIDLEAAELALAKASALLRALRQ